MKGYLMSYYFTNQKSIYIYLLLSIPICLFSLYKSNNG